MRGGMGEKVGYKVKSKLHIKSKVYVDKKKHFCPCGNEVLKNCLRKLVTFGPDSAYQFHVFFLQ